MHYLCSAKLKLMQLRTYYPTVVLSDIHLGTPHSKKEEVSKFLKSIKCDKLILNGDIIDGWHFSKEALSNLKLKHIQFFKDVMKMMDSFSTEVIYVRGNHDDFLDNFVSKTLDNIKIVKDYVYESHGKRYYVTHGDVFDSVTSRMKWLAKLGDLGYSALLWLNEKYNARRIKHGKPYHSFSKVIKRKFKKAVSFMSDFENKLISLARVNQCNGVICGHIHHPENRYYEDIHYLNSGDWVESLSALVEDEHGNWRVHHYYEDSGV